eukprot:9488040-Pyramimonas_sp.AAC.1
MGPPEPPRQASGGRLGGSAPLAARPGMARRAARAGRRAAMGRPARDALRCCAAPTSCGAFSRA